MKRAALLGLWWRRIHRLWQQGAAREWFGRDRSIVRDLSGRKLDAFDRAGLQLSDDQKKAFRDIIAAYNVAGTAVRLEDLISAVARMSPSIIERLEVEADFLKRTAA